MKPILSIVFMLATTAGFIAWSQWLWHKPLPVLETWTGEHADPLHGKMSRREFAISVRGKTASQVIDLIGTPAKVDGNAWTWSNVTYNPQNGIVDLTANVVFGPDGLVGWVSFTTEYPSRSNDEPGQKAN